MEHPVASYAIEYNIPHNVLNNAIRDYMRGKSWGLKAHKSPWGRMYAVEQIDFDAWYTQYQQNRQKRKVKTMTKIVNMTPHTITIVDSDNQIIREYPSAGVARVSTTSEITGEIDGIPVVKTSFGEVVGLPEPDGESIYIVSMPVSQATKGRTDIIGPDTGPTAYRIDGKIIGVRQFARY
jgi:hypothetical protein